MAFWGVEVKPGKPFIHAPDNGKRLHISQASLGTGSSTNKSVVQCSVGNSSPVFLCSLFPEKGEISQLHMEFEETVEVVFSVIGLRSVHLTGYLLGGRSSHRDDESESHGEDIADTKTKRSENDNDEDEYDDSFINDDNPDTTEVEKMIDEKKRKNGKGRRKRLRKKFQFIESDDEDKMPISLILERESTGKPTGSEAHEKCETEKAEKSEKKVKDNGSLVIVSKRKADAVAVESKRQTDDHHSTLPSSDKDSQNGAKPKKQMEKNGKVGEPLEDDFFSGKALGQQKCIQSEAEADKLRLDLPVTKENQKTTNDKNVEKLKKRRKKYAKEKENLEADGHLSCVHKPQPNEVETKSTLQDVLVTGKENQMNTNDEAKNTLPDMLVTDKGTQEDTNDELVSSSSMGKDVTGGNSKNGRAHNAASCNSGQQRCCPPTVDMRRRINPITTEHLPNCPRIFDKRRRINPIPSNDYSVVVKTPVSSIASPNSFAQSKHTYPNMQSFAPLIPPFQTTSMSKGYHVLPNDHEASTSAQTKNTLRDMLVTDKGTQGDTNDELVEDKIQDEDKVEKAGRDIILAKKENQKQANDGAVLPWNSNLPPTQLDPEIVTKPKRKRKLENKEHEGDFKTDSCGQGLSVQDEHDGAKRKRKRKEGVNKKIVDIDSGGHNNAIEEEEGKQDDYKSDSLDRVVSVHEEQNQKERSSVNVEKLKKRRKKYAKEKENLDADGHLSCVHKPQPNEVETKSTLQDVLVTGKENQMNTNDEAKNTLPDMLVTDKGTQEETNDELVAVLPWNSNLPPTQLDPEIVTKPKRKRKLENMKVLDAIKEHEGKEDDFKTDSCDQGLSVQDEHDGAKRKRKRKEGVKKKIVDTDSGSHNNAIKEEEENNLQLQISTCQLQMSYLFLFQPILGFW